MDDLINSTPPQPPRLLTIAGSDSGGAAGAQADLKTWTALGVYGMSVLTAVTAQNSLSVRAVHYLPPEFVAAQIDAVLSDYGAEGVKTGFIGRAALVETIAERLQAPGARPLVVDPVLVNQHGAPMFAPEVTQAYLRRLLPLADLFTPNRHEAALFLHMEPPAQPTPAWLADAARRLQALGPRAVLLKGGRIGAAQVDVLCNGTAVTFLPTPHLDTPNTHGSGDALSAAACAFLAQGIALETAVRRAQAFTAAALRAAAPWRLGAGHGPLALLAIRPIFC